MTKNNKTNVPEKLSVEFGSGDVSDLSNFIQKIGKIKEWLSFHDNKESGFVIFGDRDIEPVFKTLVDLNNKLRIFRRTKQTPSEQRRYHEIGVRLNEMAIEMEKLSKEVKSITRGPSTQSKKPKKGKVSQKSRLGNPVDPKDRPES